MSRSEAFAVLDLRGDAGADEVTRAYRRLARTLHPDLGGDVAAFHRLQRAYERLNGEDLPDARPRPAPAPTPKPSRDAASATARHQRYDTTEVDTGTVDRASTDPDGPLDVATLATRLVPEDAGPVRRVVVTSRGPGRSPSRLGALLQSDRTAALTIGPASDRGRRGHDVEITIVAWSRRDRRTLEESTRPEGWVHTRGSSTTTLARVMVPSPDPRATAVRVATEVDRTLGGLGWPLADWAPRV